MFLISIFLVNQADREYRKRNAKMIRNVRYLNKILVNNNRNNNDNIELPPIFSSTYSLPLT